MNPQTADEINKLDLQNQIDTRTALNTQLNPYDQLRNQRRINSITSSTGITPTNAPISSANLGQTNPIILPETTPSTKATGIIAGVNNATQNDLTQQAVANAKATAEAAGVGEAQKQKKTALEAIKGLFGKETTLMQESQTSPEALQIQTENTTLTDLNNKITDENAKLKAERDAITARGDISKSAQAGLITNLEDVYGRRLADLSTRQANAIGNITRLKSSLKDSLDMKLAPIEKEIQYYKDFEINNLDELSKTEKETLTNIINERTRLQTQITESHKILETALKSALDNGIKIPDDVVAQMQEKPEDSYSILASNGINLQDPLERQLKQAQIAAENRKNLPSGVPGTVSSLTQSVIDNPSLYYGFTPTQKAQIIGELQSKGYDVSNLQNVKLSTSQQEDLSSMGTVKSLIDDVLSYQKNGSLPGIGYKLGTLKGIGAQLGFGSEDEKSVRANIGNIKGTIAKLRGGTSFTTNEEKLLDSYVPSINDNPSVAINKLNNLKKFIDQKNNSLIGVVQINPTKGQIIKQGTETVTRPEDLRAKYSY